MNLSQENLKSIAKCCASKILNSHLEVEYFELPFKHLILDNFFDISIANNCLSSFPEITDQCWEHSNDAEIEIKYRTKWESEFDIPDGIIDAVRILNSSYLLRAYASRFDIHKLIPDPYFTGGGLNITKTGGLLDVHVDGNYHDATGLHRRLNAIIYLNPNWKSGWGGEFGIYDSTGNICIKKVTPLFNRLIIFDTHDKSFHGLPDPLNFPDKELRRSIILYFYTKDNRPKEVVEVIQPHSALWIKRGLTDKKGNKTREYK
jgi:hypothetical protein